MVLVIVVAVVALLAGLAANRFLRPRLMADDDAGMAVKDLVGPLLTLTVLLLAFVLVTANGSYGKGEVASRGEARALDQLTEIAEYAPAAERKRIQADAVCYARAVRTQEWPAMADDGSGSAAPSVWSTDLRHSFRDVEGKPVFGMLIAADNKRSDEREERLTQATASIPSAIFWFLLATLTVTVVALGVCLPRRNNRGQLIALTVITALLTTTLCIIRDVDRPFGGIIDVRPTAITEVERQATRDFLANHQAADLPCDDKGNRRSA
ncbi:hypothetical protein AB0O76_42350 [Streptomyces sp. NPDC086554]|uniref:bestrophin-like domain n=1 Tax=Streptomyces sp. NPDC086554 TaxID=3154864 RepID=UPI0034270096